MYCEIYFKIWICGIIIDYYLKIKISYYFVKRAFASVKFILRKEDEKILVVVINEISKDVSIDVEYGYVSFDGKQRNSIDRLMTIPARSRGVLLEIDEIEAFAKEEALLRGTYFVKPKKSTMINSQVVLPEILKLYDFRQLILSKEKPQITNFLRHGNNLKFTVTSNVFIHAVHFNFNDEIHLSDEYFDLLPGESREVEVYDVPEDIFENFIKVNYL